jgi:hypothetical protein
MGGATVEVVGGKTFDGDVGTMYVGGAGRILFPTIPP